MSEGVAHHIGHTDLTQTISNRLIACGPKLFIQANLSKLRGGAAVELAKADCFGHMPGRDRIGTGEIRDLLGGIGLTHGVLTWGDQCGDEMIGVPGHALSPDEMLASGTRIAFR